MAVRVGQEEVGAAYEWEATLKKPGKPAWPHPLRVWISYLAFNGCYQKDGRDLVRHRLLQEEAGGAQGR